VTNSALVGVSDVRFGDDRHPESMATATSGRRLAPGAERAVAELLAGNRRFMSGALRYGHNVAAAAAVSAAQHPYAVVLGCMDSRVPPEAVFDQDFGSIAVLRSAGTVLDRAVTGSLEFAVTELNVPLVLVLGHERCGAVQATVDVLRGRRRPDGSVGYLVDAIAPVVREAGLRHDEVAARAVRGQVARTVERLRAPGGGCVADAVQAGRASVIGGVYDLDTGRVDLLH
jgi:carbonic anhydrase